MPIPESERVRMINRIKERNQAAKWINTNLNPTSKIKPIPAVNTAKKLQTQDDVDALERSLDAFMDAPRELTYRGRASYSVNELSELMVMGSESERRGREKIEQIQGYIEDMGVTKAGKVTEVDELKWMDKFSARVYKYKDPSAVRSQYDFDRWKDKMHEKALTLDEHQRELDYQKLYTQQFLQNIVKQIDPEKKSSERRREAWDVYRALKEMDVKDFMVGYYTDIYGDVSFITSDRDNTDLEYGIVQDIKSAFGIEF